MNTCEHVYKLTGVDPCPLCGKPTHEINWRQMNDEHKKWVEENPNHEYVWWSIQPVIG